MRAGTICWDLGILLAVVLLCAGCAEPPEPNHAFWQVRPYLFHKDMAWIDGQVVPNRDQVYVGILGNEEYFQYDVDWWDILPLTQSSDNHLQVVFNSTQEWFRVRIVDCLAKNIPDFDACPYDWWHEIFYQDFFNVASLWLQLPPFGANSPIGIELVGTSQPPRPYSIVLGGS